MIHSPLLPLSVDIDMKLISKGEGSVYWMNGLEEPIATPGPTLSTPSCLWIQKSLISEQSNTSNVFS